MKVLWFAVTPSLFEEKSNDHNGGGWIASLELLLRSVGGVDLGIAFLHDDPSGKVEKNGVTYYPMSLNNTRLRRLYKRLFFRNEEKLEVEACLRVIDDFKPDLIHVFGSEWSFGLVAKYVRIPTIIHIQGLAHPYLNAYFPAGYSISDYFFYNGLSFRKIYHQLLAYNYFRYRAEREIRILQCNSNFMGRTRWDRGTLNLLAKDAKYYYCSEALRNAFSNSSEVWAPIVREKVILLTTISPPLYKGMDVLLKTAKLIKEYLAIDFEWLVFGVKETRFNERKIGIEVGDVNVKLMGTVTAEQLKSELLNCDVFIHPSYIDNSPNSICEAQILGVPVISTDVGGISSLITHNETGLLVPSNDPYSLAAQVKTLLCDKKLAQSLGVKARATALVRHNSASILEDLLSAYNGIKS